MTPNERQVLDYVEQFFTQHRFAPSLQQIADHLQIKSKSGAHRMVTSLLRAGYLVRTGGGVRNIAPARQSLAAFPTEALQAELQRRELVHG